MDKEALKIRATAFGIKALGIARTVVTEAGKAAFVVGKEIVLSLETIAQNIESNAANKERWQRLEGSYYSSLLFPEAFENVDAVLRHPIGSHRFSVISDQSSLQVSANTNWTEDLPGFPHSYHQLDLQLEFFVNRAGGTDVRWSWLVTDFPKGLYASQIIRIANSWIEAALECAPAETKAEGACQQ
jgi:hypothetical protein